VDFGAEIDHQLHYGLVKSWLHFGESAVSSRPSTMRRGPRRLNTTTL